MVAARERIGDWEGDTVIARLDGKHADLLAQAAAKSMQPHQGQGRTITFGNGLEFAGHATIAAGLGGYLLRAPLLPLGARDERKHPQGASTNGLIRQYSPKGTDFSTVTDGEIAFVPNGHK